MKKGRIWIIIIAIIAILVLWFVKLNNRMVAAEEKAVQAWSQVETFTSEGQTSSLIW
jgi:hypothetical protein